MRRQLGPFETALTLTGEHAPFVVVAVLRLEGRLGPERLHLALDLLARHHPMLGVRVAQRGHDFFYEPLEAPEIPLTTVERRDEEHWKEVAELELNTPLDRGAGPLLRATLLVPLGPSSSATGGASEIILSFHHAAVDATSGAPLLAQLLALCGAKSEEEARLRARELPPSLPMPPAQEHLPPRWRGLAGRGRSLAFLARQIADEVLFRRRSRGLRQPRVVPATTCRILPLELDEATTEALVRRTRRERVTLAGMLQAALLLSLWKGLYDGVPGPFRYISFADLRPFLKPPIPRQALGSCITFVRHTARLGRDTDLWDLAREVSTQVRDGGHRGDKLASFLLSAPMMRMTLRRGTDRMGHSAVSYSGAMSLGDDSGALRLRGLHAFVSNFALGPELTAQARLFNRRLGIDAVFLDCDLDRPHAEALGREVIALLTRAARDQAPEEKR